MVSRYRNVPIEAARQIANAFDKDQVIIVCWEKAHGKIHVTTYGKTVDDCTQAAAGGNLVKKTLGWPDEMCHAIPRRARKCRI